MIQVEVLDAARDRVGGYKVDVSRGQRALRAVNRTSTTKSTSQHDSSAVRVECPDQLVCGRRTPCACSSSSTEVATRSTPPFVCCTLRTP